MSDLVENVGILASLIGSFTVVGGALIWIYNKFIGAPREKRREKESAKRQAQMVELITKKNEPLNSAIEDLNVLLTESQLDRQHLNRVADENTDKIVVHEERLDNHNDRLIVLETKNGVRKVSYRERED